MHCEEGAACGHLKDVYHLCGGGGGRGRKRKTRKEDGQVGRTSGADKWDAHTGHTESHRVTRRGREMAEWERGKGAQARRQEGRAKG